MKAIRLGKTGLRVSRIGFGGIPIQRLSADEAVRVVQRCLDLGITFFDTATGYTTSEERIGRALAGRREQVVLATKTPAQDKVTARQHLDQSLQRLSTDYIDLWQFHNVSTFPAYERILGPGGAMEAAQEARQAGQVRHIGITTHSMDVALQAVPSGHFETIQFPLNFITDEAVGKLLPVAREHDLGFIAMKPLGGGLLDDARLAIKWLLQFDDVLPDPGVQAVAEVEEIVDTVNGPWALTPQERQALQRIRAEVDTRFCRRCDYCQPCPQKVPISTVMNLGSFWKRFPPDRFFSGFVAEAAESARGCEQCGECEERCPFQLPIREMIAENLDLYDRLRREMGHSESRGN